MYLDTVPRNFLRFLSFVLPEEVVLYEERTIGRVEEGNDRSNLIDAVALTVDCGQVRNPVFQAQQIVKNASINRAQDRGEHMLPIARLPVVISYQPQTTTRPSIDLSNLPCQPSRAAARDEQENVGGRPLDERFQPAAIVVIVWGAGGSLVTLLIDSPQRVTSQRRGPKYHRNPGHRGPVFQRESNESFPFNVFLAFSTVGTIATTHLPTSNFEDYVPYLSGAVGAAVITGVAAYYATRPRPEKPLWPLDAQSTLLPGTDLIRVSRFYKDSKEGRFVSFINEDTRTLYDGFRRGAKESNNGRCLGWRDGPNKPYQWLHYNEALLRAKNLGSGLVSLGLVPGQHTLVGLYSLNCPEWILTEQACYTYSLVVVPLYDTLGPDACAYIINQADISLVVCEDDKKCNLLLDKAPRCLRKLIVIKETRPATNQRAKNRGVELLRFEDIERLGAQKNHPEIPPKVTDLCTICYTSGTTGNPKGVMLTHQNVMAGVCAVLLQLGDHKPTCRDTMISFLPLAHMLERCCENGLYMVGGSVGFYTGDIKRLSDDMKALRPTVMPAVPRLLNRMYDKVQAELQSSFFKRMIFNMGMRSKEREIKKSIVRNNSMWDRLVFKKIQESMGGRLRLMLVGSAPLAGNVLTFARCALGCLVVEGYGQTECAAPITLTIQGDHVPEHVGPPVACCCVKLVDVPEMEYFAINNQGEVCVKGTNVFVGYFKDPEKTAEVIDEIGWHHTGDVGMWLPNGTLKIIDRKKHIFKLSQGEYIVPEKIENIYMRSQYVHQVFVHGESLKSCVVGIVVPDVDVVKCWAVENRIPGTLSVLCANPEVKRLILDDMLSWGKEAGLKSFEQVKDIYLHPDPFSIQNGLLTPTLKTKRPQLKAYFKPQIEDLYQHLD